MVQPGKKIKIKDKFWYYVDLKDPLKPKVLNDFYEFDEEVKNCMDMHLKNRKRYFPVKGTLLKEFRGQFEIIKPPYSMKLPMDWRNAPVFLSDSEKLIVRRRRNRIRIAKAKRLGLYKIFRTYEYPEWCKTKRQRKTYREMQRRKMYRYLKAIY